jgi:hypothetical protein
MIRQIFFSPRFFRRARDRASPDSGTAAGAHAELVEIGLEGEDAMATKRTTKSYDDTTAAAREIIDAQDRAHDAKTARLRKARLDKEEPP